MTDFFQKLDALYKANNLSAVEAFILDAVRTTDEGSLERAALYNELAVFYMDCGRYIESESAFNNSLKLFDTADMDIAPEYVTVLMNLTELSRMKGKVGGHRSTLEGFRKTLELTHEFFGDSVEFAECKRNIAEIYELLGDLPSAIAELTDAAEMTEQLLGPDHPSVIELRKKLDLCLSEFRKDRHK